MWIEEGLCVSELEIDIPQQCKEMKVADLVDFNGNWNFEMLNQWLPYDVVQRIMTIAVPDENDGNDKQMWSVSSNGKFTIASAYHMLSNFDNAAQDETWLKLWKIRAPERIKHFMWMLYHGRLLTNLRKHKMGIGNPMCRFCHDEIESEIHVLRDCPKATALWLCVVDIAARTSFFEGDLSHWIKFNLFTNVYWNHNVDWSDFWATACHAIWNWRNKETHNDNYQRPLHAKNIIMSYVNDYHNAIAKSVIVTAQPRHLEEVGWKEPPIGWVKINTDGACKDGSIAGCGGLIRGSEGEWLAGFSKFLGKCNAFIAELWGVLEGLRCAKRMGFTAVELNVDSLVVVNIVTSGKESNASGRSLVQKIRKLLQMEWEVKVKHSYREANRCADALANIGCIVGNEMMFYESCPTQINHLLAADQAGVTFPRLIKM